MKVKTQDLNGTSLDWATAVARGHNPKKFILGCGYHDPSKAHIVTQILVSDNAGGAYHYGPSTGGDEAIDIVEDEGISVYKQAQGVKTDNPLYQPHVWYAHLDGGHRVTGPTFRAAVCRCYVLSKLGDEVDVPDELMQ